MMSEAKEDKKNRIVFSVSPSSAARVNACPASLVLDTVYGKGMSAATAEAAVGTVIHELALAKLYERQPRFPWNAPAGETDEEASERKRHLPYSFTNWPVGQVLRVTDGGEVTEMPVHEDERIPYEQAVMVEVSREMHEVARRYVRWLEKEIEGARPVFIEIRNKASLHPFVRNNLQDLGGVGEKDYDYDFQLHGTPDAWWVRDNTLHIADLKTGLYPVPVQDNLQLLAYALIADAELLKSVGQAPHDFGVGPGGIEKVRLIIYQQDRDAMEPPEITSYEIPYDSMLKAENMLAEKLHGAFAAGVAAAGAMPVDPKTNTEWLDALNYTVGRHCVFCPHLLYCRAQHKHLKAYGDGAYERLTQDRSPAHWGYLMDALSDAERNIKTMKSAILSLTLANGEDVPTGYELRKRTNRRWRDREETVKFLIQSKLHNQLRPSSPASVEKEANRLGWEPPDISEDIGRLCETLEEAPVTHYLQRTR